MAHSSELRWDDAAQLVAGAAEQTIGILKSAEEVYQELLEAYNYAGGTDQAFADQLFATTADVDQVAKVTDLRLAIQALHELHQSADNVAVAQGDRYAAMRRMS